MTAVGDPRQLAYIAGCTAVVIEGGTQVQAGGGQCVEDDGIGDQSPLWLLLHLRGQQAWDFVLHVPIVPEP